MINFFKYFQDYQSIFLPERNWLYVLFVQLESFLVISTALNQLSNVLLVDLNALVTQILKLIIFDIQTVSWLLSSWVIYVLVFGLRIHFHEVILQIVQLVGCCHLVQDVNFRKVVFFPVFYCQSQTFQGVVDVDESSCLFSCSIKSDWVTTSNLGTESVQYCSEVTIDIDSIDQIWMQFTFRCANSPNNTLMEFSDFQLEKFLEVQQGYIVKTLGHMIHTSWIIRMDNFNCLAITLLCVSAMEFGHTEAFGNITAFNGSISIYTHSTNVNEMAFFVVLHHGNKDVFRW